MNKLVILLLFLLLSACSPNIPPNTGVEGQVWIGPMCPVVREGEDCPDSPYQATLTITKPNGRRVAQIQSDENGYFQVELAPGEYILHPETEGISYAAEQSFAVLDGEFTFLTVSYDSGIR